MVNAGRVACLFTPFALTIVALVCLAFVFLAGIKERNATLDDLYFVKLNLVNLTTAASANLAHSDTAANLTALAGALQAAKQSMGMYDYYTVYLRSYCAWNGDDRYKFCSSPEAKFYFDPIKIWGLNSTSLGQDYTAVLPKSFVDGLDTYEKVSVAMFYVYVVALVVTALTVLVGISAMFSRWGSFATTFFSIASAVLFLAGSAMATAMFLALKTTVNETLKDDYGINAEYGSRIYVVTWAGVAFAVASALFWLLSICCCSGRTPYNPGNKDARRTRAEKTPYTYERVGSPYLGPQGQQAVPLNNLNGHGGYTAGPNPQKSSAYEPFRSQPV